jgi:hypothetical protein
MRRSLDARGTRLVSRVRAAGSAHENRDPTISSYLITPGQAVEAAGAYPACAPMFARVTTFQGAPDSVDGPIRFAVNGQSGCEGTAGLPRSNRSLGPGVRSSADRDVVGDQGSARRKRGLCSRSDRESR